MTKRTIGLFTLICLASAGRALATTEGFEGLTPGANNPVPAWAFAFNSGDMAVGAVTPFTFASGVTYSAPVPNPDLLSIGGGGGLVGDWAVGEAPWGLGGNGAINSAADVPFGTAFFALDTLSCTPITFTFASTVSMVGAFADTAPGGCGGNLVTEQAFNGGTLLATATISGVPVANWGSNFISISTPGITSVTFSGEAVVLDNLTFTPTPEPATLTLFGTGVASLLAAYRRRRKGSC